MLAEAGADVVVAARTTSQIESVANEVRALGRQALAIPTDVTQSSSVNAMVEETVRQYGKVDILVNNAGQILRAPVAPLPDVTFKPPRVTRESNVPTSDDEWQSIMDANLNSVFYCCRAVAPHMLERRYGKIINISSNNGTQAFILMSAYSASKAALNMLTRVLALEWVDYNICVNAIGPGDFNTAMTEPTWVDPVERQRHLDGIPMHRESDLRELGVLAVYLASAALDYMTGQIIYLDGGHTAK